MKANNIIIKGQICKLAPVSLLPNINGYTYLAILKDGSIRQGMVRLDSKTQTYRADFYKEMAHWVSFKSFNIETVNLFKLHKLAQAC